jgi:hypothetical protein
MAAGGRCDQGAYIPARTPHWYLLSILMALQPQKVKNIDTSIPMAAAPLAIMKTAMALSKSPDNRNDRNIVFRDALFDFLEVIFEGEDT